MAAADNKHEVNLLLNDPKSLVTHYQSIIEIVVSKFITRGFFKKENKMDVVQDINEALIERKMSNIQRNYNGSVLLATYFSKVVYNHCLEIARRQKNKPETISEELLKNVSDTRFSAVDQLVLKDEVKRLDVILNGIIKLSLRMLLTLKLYARVPIANADFQGFLFSKDEQFEAFKKAFYQPFDDLNDKEVYLKAIPFLNKVTNKNTDADSLRKWLNMQVDKIIELQNGNPPRSGHSRESIRILLQMYFENDNKS